MKGEGKYTELQVVEQLQRKADIRISGNNVMIMSGDRAKGDIGIKSRGKIDFLVNHCGYFYTFVKAF